MLFIKITTTFLMFLIAVLFVEGVCLQQAIADIYTYTDEKGVMHFSNVPTSPKYRLKWREIHFDYKRLSSGMYDGLITEVCMKHDLDPLLVKAVIKAESDFDPTAVSAKGAKGLMQLMPTTAGDMGINDIYDPENNIEGGVKYLKRLMGIFKSDLRLVVAAYNAGENTVIKYKNIPPFKETREYVEKVFKHLNSYERMSRGRRFSPQKANSSDTTITAESTNPY
ncbi:MAG: lytic transglycosylase domain-containing protein [Deltaproteobacteria bacterium]|nr:lytic transglycosylase domain-containing protein [Deltaproteobacteria bacterium]